jgi:lysine/ornithine N-monooxygenase
MHGFHSNEPYDLVGIGFGPSNLALAVAMPELLPETACLFLERNPSFQWHPGMLFESSRMQISYLKDLVTMRDPTSPFSFLNYLKQAGRLETFLNLNELHPTRLEYSGYLAWVADQCADRVRYGVRVETVSPTPDGSLFEVGLRDASTGATETVLARDLVVALGGIPRIPPGVDAARAIHSSEFLPRFAQTMAAAAGTGRVVLAGSGQSAGEIALHILTEYPSVELHLAISGYALRPTDNSPFVNEQFYS